MKLSPSDSIEEVINRYPLTVEYFVDAGYEDEWQTGISAFAREQNTTLQQLERDLRNHLENAVRPDVEDCESISCDPLPFCPEDVNLIGVRQLFRGVEWTLKLAGSLIAETEHTNH